jgi:hypothetical protein
MAPERNAPCPCGSGRKYKKCCCAASRTNPQPEPVELNRIIAYQGAVGAARRLFCENYSTQKQTKLASIHSELSRQLLENGYEITCREGCAHCCKLFVVASLEECEAIVNYLYANQDALDHFIASFVAWRSRVSRISGVFRNINDLHQIITSGSATEQDRLRFGEECDAYAAAGIMCPFNTSGSCDIYGVRPYVCARVVAATPPEWCSPGHPRHAEALHFKAPPQKGEPVYFALSGKSVVFASMPSLVFDLLHDGFGALAGVPGMERLRDEHLRDPEVIKAIRAYMVTRGGDL